MSNARSLKAVHVGPALALLALAYGAAQAEPVRGVVELFTSQGCSSCPPADALLRTFAQDPGILALSLPVNYWDYIGWKDTLASESLTVRQKAYATTRGDHQIYTPQAVIDGASHVIGSDSAAIGKALRALGQQQGAFSVPLTVSDIDGKLKIEVGAAHKMGDGEANVWLLTVAKSVSVLIQRGENAGRTVTYTNVVRSITRIGRWSGESSIFDFTKPSDAGALGFAVLVQTGSPGRPGLILGAAKQNL